RHGVGQDARGRADRGGADQDHERGQAGAYDAERNEQQQREAEGGHHGFRRRAMSIAACASIRPARIHTAVLIRKYPGLLVSGNVSSPRIELSTMSLLPMSTKSAQGTSKAAPRRVSARRTLVG